MRYEKSCGIIVFRKEKEDLEVLLIHHNLGHWGFPKGHQEFGETDIETALREVYEETGINAKIIEGFKEKVTYSPKKDVSKDVYFYVGLALDFNLVAQLSEVCEAKFVKYNEVGNILTFDMETKLYDKALAFYKNKFEK